VLVFSALWPFKPEANSIIGLPMTLESYSLTTGEKGPFCPSEMSRLGAHVLLFY